MACKGPDEFLLSSEPVQDPYSTDEEQETDIENKKKMYRGTLLQCNITASDCSPIELMKFLNFDYVGVNVESNMMKASVTKLIEESFKFIFTDGVPKFFKYKRFPVGSASWEKMASLMWEDFTKRSTIKWQQENHTIDYSVATNEEIEKMEFDLNKACEKLQKVCESDEDIWQMATTDLVQELHSMLKLCIRTDIDNSRKENTQVKSLKHDVVKNTYYSMFNIAFLRCRVNGASRLSEFHPPFANLTSNGVNITAKPDAVLSVKVASESYPYLTVQVYNQDEFSTTSSSGTSTSGDTDKESDSGNEDSNYSIMESTELKFKSIALSKESGQRERTFYQNKQLKEKLMNEIITKSPISVNEMPLAFKKSTGQLAMEMYVSLLKQMRIKLKLNKLTKHDDKSQAVGLFIVNEFVYLEKIVAPNIIGIHVAEGKPILHSKEGPSVHLANWKFDLKLPNHRLAFQAFLFYFEKLVCGELYS